jgi:AcrR family transcriptional regulator
VAVAHDALAESADASLNSIAKRAGVGAGTLYRHFPTREALILEVHRHGMGRLVDSVPDVLAAYAPLDELRHWCTTLATYVRIKHGLGEALHSAAAQEVVSASPPVTAAVGQLLDACERAGEVRPGIDPVDVIMLMSCLWRTPDNPDGAAQSDRLLELAIDGLRPYGVPTRATPPRAPGLPAGCSGGVSRRHDGTRLGVGDRRPAGGTRRRLAVRWRLRRIQTLLVPSGSHVTHGYTATTPKAQTPCALVRTRACSPFLNRLPVDRRCRQAARCRLPEPNRCPNAWVKKATSCN